MTDKDIAEVFHEVINSSLGDRQQLLDKLSHEDRSEIEELLAADQMASDNNLLGSLNYGVDEKTFRGKKPEQIHDYKIHELIGEGGMGQVYKAHHSRLNFDVAIKILSRPDRPRRQDDVARFDREIAAIGSLQHPNIVQATDAGVDGDTNYLVMEFVDGPDVSRVLKAKGKLSLADACEIIRQAALGLSHAHTRGLIHRDVKPSNLMIATDGTVKLADMGLALLRDWDSQVSRAGQIMGTLDYMAPEQIDGSQSVDQRSDLYSLGCMFYELLSGSPPFAPPEFETTLEKMKGHSQGTPPALSDVSPDVPAEAVTIIERLMAKDPAKRFQTAAELAKVIAPLAKGEQVRSLAHNTLGISAASLETGRIDEHDAQTLQRTQALPASVSTFKEEKKSSLSFKLIALGLLFALGLAMALNTNQIIRIVTNKGTLVIENSEDVVVTITRGNDEPVVVFDKVNRRQYTLEAGDNYQLLVKEPKSGVALSSTTFSIKRNAKTILNAHVEPLDPKKSSQLGLENYSQGELVNWMLDRGVQIKGYDKDNNYMTLGGSKRVSPTIDLSGNSLELWVDTKQVPESELQELWQASSLLPIDLLFYFGGTPSSSTLRAIAQQKNITHVRFYSGFDFTELDKLPAGSFAHARVLMLHGVLPTDKVELLASHFTNISRLNIAEFDYEQIETLKRFPLDKLIVQIGVSQQLPKLDTHEKLKSLTVVYSPNFPQEPKLSFEHLPPDIRNLLVHNASLTVEHVKQLSQYEQLSSVEFAFYAACIRDSLDMSAASAEFEKLRPDVKFKLTTPSRQSLVQRQKPAWKPVIKDTGMDWLTEHSDQLQLNTPASVESSTNTETAPDLYSSQTLIDGSGMSNPIVSLDQIRYLKHGYTIEKSGWVTGPYFPGYFERKDPSLPKLTFTLNESATIEAMIYWGYVHAKTTDGSRNEPKALRFTFLDKKGNQVGDKVSHSVSRPIQFSARVISFPAVKDVYKIEIEILDNFFNEIKLISGGDRVGLGEVRFLSTKK